MSRFWQTPQSDSISSRPWIAISARTGDSRALVATVAGLALLAHYIISLLYERGESTPNDTAQAAGALQFYAIGLVAYSGIKVLAPAFYARQDTRTPMRVAIVTVLPMLWSRTLFGPFISFLSGSGIGNEIAFYIFDYPPEDELLVRDFLRTLLDHIPKHTDY